MTNTGIFSIKLLLILYTHYSMIVNKSNFNWGTTGIHILLMHFVHYNWAIMEKKVLYTKVLLHIKTKKKIWNSFQSFSTMKSFLRAVQQDCVSVQYSARLWGPRQTHRLWSQQRVRVWGEKNLLILWHRRVHGTRGREPEGPRHGGGLVVVRRTHGELPAHRFYRLKPSFYPLKLLDPLQVLNLFEIYIDENSVKQDLVFIAP